MERFAVYDNNNSSEAEEAEARRGCKERHNTENESLEIEVRSRFYDQSFIIRVPMRILCIFDTLGERRRASSRIRVEYRSPPSRVVTCFSRTGGAFPAVVSI